MPRVTVIMATYNWATVLPYSIASVLDQRFTDFELLVVGDGCSDESGEVVAAMRDSRVSWHNLPANTGHQSGPNTEGIRRARGEVIAYIGHDDLWLPGHLELLVGAVEGGARIAHSTIFSVPPSGDPTMRPRDGWVYEPGVNIAPTSVVHERALVDAAGGWRHPRDTGTLESEAELWGRMAALGHSPQWVPRLTCVKFAAGVRAGVYRERPNHEQAYWLARIREANNPERSLAAACAKPRPDTIRRRVMRVVGPRVRVRTRLRRLGVLPRLPPAAPTRPAPALTAEARRRATRRFKGIDDERTHD